MVSTQAALIGALTLFLVFFMNYAILHQRRHEGYKAKERQTYVSVKSSILELKSKIKLFKIKGIETDELELILGKVKKEMINEQPPVM